MPERQEAQTATEATDGGAELMRLMQKPIGETINDRGAYKRCLAPYIEDVLPGGITAERVHAVARLVVKQSSYLAECNGGSVWKAVLSILSAGLTPDAVLGEAYIVPFKGEATPVIGYKGYRTLAYNHPKVCKVEAKVVRDGDEFEVEYGTEQRLRHTPCGDAGTSDEDFIGAWALAVLQDGATLIQWVPKGTILEHRSRSASFKSGRNSPWVTDPEPMWAKTAFRILVPFLPQSRQLALAAALDQRDEDMGKGKDFYAVTETDHAVERAIEAATEAPSSTTRLKKALKKDAPDEAPPAAPADLFDRPSRSAKPSEIGTGAAADDPLDDLKSRIANAAAARERKVPGWAWGCNDKARLEGLLAELTKKES